MNLIPCVSVVLILAVMMSIRSVGAVGSYDPAFWGYIYEHDVGEDVAVAVPNVTHTVPPYDFHISVFFEPGLPTHEAYMYGAVPLCIAFNLPNRFNEQLTVYADTIADVLRGTSSTIYTDAVFPTAHSVSSNWSWGLPRPGTPTARALLDSLTTATQHGFTPGPGGTYPAKVASQVTTQYFQQDEEIAQYVSRTPYSMGVMKFPVAAMARLPCLRVRVPQPGVSDSIEHPRLHFHQNDKYNWNTTTLSLSVLRYDFPVYPFVGPLVFQFPSNYSCDAAGLAVEEFFLFLLRDPHSDAGLNKVAGVRVSAEVLNQVLAKAVANFCEKGVVLPMASIPATDAPIAAYISNKFNKHGLTGRVDVFPTSQQNIDAVSRGTHLMGVTEIPPTQDDYSRLPTLRLLPVLSRSFAIVFNTGEEDLELHIFRCVLVQIFNGSVEYWDDPSIQDENPQVLFPHIPIHLIVREDSAANYVMTRGLTAMEEKCNRGRSPTSFSVSTTWPLKNKHITYATDDDDLLTKLKTIPYSLTYATHNLIESHRLSHFAIEDPESNIHVEPLEFTSSLTAAELSDKSEIKLDPSQPDAYPFVSVSYVAYNGNPTTTDNCFQQQHVTSFLEYLLNDENAIEITAQYGYASMPWMVRNRAVEALYRHAKCDGKFIFPQPDNSVDNTVRDAVVSVVVVVFVAVSVGVAVKLYSRYKSVAHAPKIATEKFACMIIMLKRESQLWETYPTSMPTVLLKMEEVMERCVRRGRCYRVKEIGSATVFTAKTVQDCVALAEDMLRQFHNIPFNQMLSAEGHTFNDDLSSFASFQNGCHSAVSGRSSMVSRRQSSSCSHRDSCASTNYTRHASDAALPADRRQGERMEVAFSVGVHFDVGRINYRKESHTYDYTGPCVDIAALTADMAQGHQFLMTASCMNNGEVPKRLFPFSTLTIGSKELQVLQYNPEGLPARTFEVRTDDAVDSIAATLQQSSTGVASKRVVCAFANVGIPDIGGEPEAVAKKYKERLETIYGIVRGQKGHVHSLFGGQLHLSFNGVQPTPQALKRSCLVALALQEAFEPTPVSYGMHNDSALVGAFAQPSDDADTTKKKMPPGKGKRPGKGDGSTSGSTSSGEHHAIISKGVEVAQTIHRIGQRLDPTLITIPSTLEDEFSSFAKLQYVDIIRVPGGENDVVVGVVAVCGLKESGAMDEWMYELEEGEAKDPYAVINAIYKELLNCMITPSAFEGVKTLYTQTRTSLEGNKSFLNCHGMRTLERIFQKEGLVDYLDQHFQGKYAGIV